MKVSPTSLPGPLCFEPKVFKDDRGAFFEGWNHQRYLAAGVTGEYTQDNISWSSKNVLRGLHLQSPRGQGKLVSVLCGAVYDVVVDVRLNSPTFGKWEGFYLDEDHYKQIYIPIGFAHGFVVLSEKALFHYKCTGHYYHPQDEISISWNDQDLGIHWPVKDPILSEKDALGSRLRDISHERLAFSHQVPNHTHDALAS